MIAKMLFSGSFEHHVRFDTKAKAFDRGGHVLVCECVQDGVLCGVICAGLKRVWLAGSVALIGYLFDLRCHDNYRRAGVGRRLSNAIEAACASSGAQRMYLTVNGNNEPAKALYNSLGYTCASHRAPSVVLLLPPAPAGSLATRLVLGDSSGRGGGSGRSSGDNASNDDPRGAIVVRCIRDGAAACALVGPHLQGVDMAPSMPQHLYEAPHFLGTYVARWEQQCKDDDHGRELAAAFGAVSLWDGSALGGLALDRLILPVCWLVRATRAAATALRRLDSIVGEAGLWCVVAALVALLPRWLLTLLALLLAGALGMRRTDARTLLLLVPRLPDLLSFAAAALTAFRGARSGVALSSSGPKQRLRLFAPLAVGEGGRSLLRSAIAKAHADHSAATAGPTNLGNRSGGGFAASFANVDAEHPLARPCGRGPPVADSSADSAPCFGPAAFRTQFLQKALVGARDDGSAVLPRFAHDNFHDPRDI